ncbi:MAG: alpha-glucan family phosphorylase [Rikenellaceae bacterium]
MSDSKNCLDHLFEVSWEVCNKVGGIHTVIATKALTVSKEMGERYILVGPDISQYGGNPEFEEDLELMKSWRLFLYSEGIRVRIGRWKIVSNPIVILVDFTSFFSKKDDVLARLWENYQVDSLSGAWDYTESILFGHAAGVVIDSYVKTFCKPTEKVAAHFHEWMTASGGLYLRTHSPRIATVFTTHATVMGRCIAGNRLPLYNELNNFNADELAQRFNVVSRHSIEKAAAHNYDAFATVSDITANECAALLGRNVDIVTPNGFEDDIVWKGEEYAAKRSSAREKMIGVAESLFEYKYETEPLIIGTSGRYEYRNKGIDLFLEALKALDANPALDREILVYFTVPAGDHGARKDLLARMEDATQPLDPSQSRHITHYIENPQWDPILNSISGSSLEGGSSKIKVVFVPAYLNERTGLFECAYYELLSGMDLTVYASYYEPWGYTPLESAAFSIPTITTTLAGFGVWVNTLEEHSGVEVIDRNDYNDGEVISAVAASIARFASFNDEQVAQIRKSASNTAATALWSNLIEKYYQAYSIAVDNSMNRTDGAYVAQESYDIREDYSSFVNKVKVDSNPNWGRVLIEKSLPERLHALEELSRNLWWCWTASARNLFEYIDRELWVAVERNPIILLDRISSQRMSELECDEPFLAEMDRIYAEFQTYMSTKPDAGMPEIAYFSMEYGLHSSLKIYSGGLGVLAGDYLKEASDRNTPMAAVGLLYRYGYFTQKLSAQGEQEASYEAQNFAKLPIAPVRNEDGSWVTVEVSFPGRTVSARVWKCPVGRTDLFLLDTDYEDNWQEDRQITHHLYGGDWENRLKQEILLGIGGMRALKAMGIEKQVYHCNEGHAAFIGVERMRTLINEKGLRFSEAKEVVRSTALFTTHTPVPAGHDAFPEHMIRQYMSHYPQVLGISWEEYIHLGKVNLHDSEERFSMSILACNLSQEVNGVSWLHGEVSKDIMGHMWPGYFKDELHIGYVTNGVHYPTWVASNLRNLYERYMPKSYIAKTYDIPAWQGVKNIPDEQLWEARMRLKTRLINHIRSRYENPSNVRFDSPSQIVRIMEGLKPEVLTIGFARRFATYKRASLLFTNLDRLEAIVNNPKRPVQFVFAGKAHPNDKPGQDLIKRIVEVSLMPQFIGKIIFIQNYDMELARHLVQGVDVWLNTPTRPLEASGTSGEKCVMNGVLQFSVLDGWWVEGYRKDAGWMLPMERTFADQRFQNELDAEKIYTTIEEEIAPLYYKSREAGSWIPTEWLKFVKNCVADVASNFTMNRQLVDYEERFYNQLAERGEWIKKDDFAEARAIAEWKKKVYNNWEAVNVVDTQKTSMDSGSIVVGGNYAFEVTLNIANLNSEDVGVELVIADQIEYGQRAKVVETRQLEVVSTEGSLVTYRLDLVPKDTGSYDIAMRIFPKSDKLRHRMDLPLVKWV